MSQPDQLPTANPLVTKGVDRRTVIRSVGVVGVGTAALAACGSGGDKTSTAGSPAAGAAGTAATSDGGAGSAKDVFKVSDIPVGGGKVFDSANVVVTQPKAGEFKAFSATCTHKGCTVGGVADGTINCPCHGSKYDITTGAVKAGPAPSPLPSKPVTVSGDSVTVT